MSQRQSVKLLVKGSLVRDPSGSLCGVLEQDILYCASYWFYPGRQENIRTWPARSVASLDMLLSKEPQKMAGAYVCMKISEYPHISYIRIEQLTTNNTL